MYAVFSRTRCAPPRRVSDVAVTATACAALSVASFGRESDILCVRVDDTLRSLVCLIAVALTLGRPDVLTAQSLEALPVACKGQIVSRIEVHTRPPFEIRGSKMQQRIAKRVTQLHATTNPEVIQRFLELKPGEPCTELRRLESERILRAQPYLADATVQAFPDDDGTVSIFVRTVDEISLILGGGVSGKSPYLLGFRIGEANLMGEAMSVDGSWRYNRDFRDQVGGQFTDYQLFDRPWLLHVEATRRERGQDWGFEVSHPFLTDLQLVSWRSIAGNADGYTRFRRPDGTSLLFPFRRSYADIGGVGRIGRPGRIALLGASLSFERELPGTVPLLQTPPSRKFEPEPGSPLTSMFTAHHIARINALFGVRDVDFLQVSGFESLDGFQDIRRGVEIAGLVGTGVEALGSDSNDLFLSGDLYTGFGSSRAFGALEVLAEGRRPEGGGEWDGLLASGRAATYLKPEDRHTIVADLEWGAGWRQLVPFQLSLADRDGGPLGYRRFVLAGARRIVTRVEDRVLLGHVREFATVGVAPFVNTGQLWAGDAPFGSNTGVRFSTGISLLAAVPSRSQRLWRMDLAFPVQPENGAKWTIRITSQNFTRMFWKEPNDVARNRERAIPTSIFNWP
jgi:hypothetical protein